MMRPLNGYFDPAGFFNPAIRIKTVYRQPSGESNVGSEQACSDL
jgi:hypothetical protein